MSRQPSRAPDKCSHARLVPTSTSGKPLAQPALWLYKMGIYKLGCMGFMHQLLPPAMQVPFLCLPMSCPHATTFFMHGS